MFVHLLSKWYFTCVGVSWYLKDINICVKMIFAGWCQFSTVGSHGASVATSCQRYNGVYHYIVSLSKSSSLLSIIIYDVSSSKSYSRHFEHCTRIDKATPFSDIKHACHCIHFICYEDHPGSFKNKSPQIGPRSVDIFTYRAFSLVIFGDISRILGIR